MQERAIRPCSLMHELNYCVVYLVSTLPATGSHSKRIAPPPTLLEYIVYSVVQFFCTIRSTEYIFLHYQLPVKKG